MKIPKGTTVFINTWGLHHDPSTTPQPHIFDPTRHTLTSQKLAPELAISPSYSQRDHYGYGSGRRMCPGIHLAERNLWLAMAKLLWAFEFHEIAGKEIDVEFATGYSEGFLCCAKPFEADIRVRGNARKDTILKEFAAAEAEVFAKFEQG